MKIITISGLDGSGKSTQIQLLKNHLESQGKKVFYFHAIKFSIANRISNLCHRDPVPLSGRNDKQKSVTRASLFTIWLRKIFLKIDLWRFNKLVKKLEKEDCDYLVSDRYFYDSMVNIEYLEKNLHDKCRERINAFRNTEERKFAFPTTKNDIIQPDLSIYLQVSPEIIMSRDRVPDQGLDYLKKKKELYENKIDVWGMKIVDGSRDKNVVFEDIKNYL